MDRRSTGVALVKTLVMLVNVKGVMRGNRMESARPHALAHHAVLVTRNRRLFDRIEGLVVEDRQA